MTEDAAAEGSKRPRIGLLAPMPSELRPLVRAARLRPSRVGGLLVQGGSAGGATIVAISTGIGMGAAGAATTRLLDALALDHVIVTGIAGGIAPELQVADLVVPETVQDARTGVLHRPSPLPGLPAHGILRSSDEIVADVEAARRMHARGIVAVDMETAAVAAACEGRCRWSVVRAVSDRAGETPRGIFALARPDGSPDVLAAMRYVLASPRRIPMLLRLARDASRAARAAAAAALRTCEALPQEASGRSD